MGSFSNYLEAKFLGHMVGKAVFTMPTVYIGLSTADPTEDGSGLAEPSGNGYARKVTSGATWNAAVEGAPSSIDNAADITFDTATGSWGTITHFALFDAVSGGNMLGHAAFSTAKAIANGETAKFTAGDLDITLD